MRPPILDPTEKSLLLTKLRSVVSRPEVSDRLRDEVRPKVLDVMLMGPRTWTVYVEDKQSVFVTDVVFQLGELVTECTCEMGGECTHVAAAAHFFLTGNISPPVPSPKVALPVPSKPVATELALTPATAHPMAANGFAQEFERRLQRKLTPSEHNAARRIDFIFAKYGSPAKVSRSELIPLVDSATFWHGMGSTNLWKQRPANVWEAWLHLARVMEAEEVEPIPALRQITTAEEIELLLGDQLQQEKVDSWKAFMRDAMKQERAREQLARDSLDLRLRLAGDSITLVQTTNPDAPFETMPAAMYRDLLEERPITSFLLTKNARIVWEAFTNTFLTSHPTSPRVSHLGNTTGTILRCLFEHPDALQCLENPHGQPFLSTSEKLVWSLLQNEKPARTYRLALVLEDGKEPPERLCMVPCEVIYFFSLTHVYLGPPPMNLLGKMHELDSIPAEVVESREGLQFLERVGAALPESFQERIKRLKPKYRIEIALLEETSPWEALQAELLADYGLDGGVESIGHAGASVHTSALPGGPGMVIFRETGDHLTTRNIMLAGGMSWSQRLRKWTRAMGDRFADEFYEWLQVIPKHVDVYLDPLLKSLQEGNLMGKLAIKAEPSGVDWFNLEVVMDTDDLALLPAEIQALMKARGKWVRLPRHGFRRLNFDFTEEDATNLADLGLRLQDVDGEPTRMHALQLAHPSLSKFLPREAAENFQLRAQELKTHATPHVPTTITATLRSYQIEGFHFLAYLSENNFGGLLADDMGLGKTLQTLAWIAWLRARAEFDGRPMLVVCPKSVTDGWLTEAAKFYPSLRTRRYQSAGSTQPKHLELHIQGAGLFVTNYAQMRILEDELSKITWHALILDEAQYIKNPTSQTTKAAGKLQATHRLALSGTPIENRLLDLWSVMDFAMPGLLGGRTTFQKNYNAKDDPQALRRLAARVRPFLLRRTKLEVAKDLPERIEEDRLCEMDGPQETLYQAELKRAQQILLNAKTNQELDKLRFTILGSLTRLRQICCHPSLVSKEPEFQAAESTKLNALMDLLEPLMEEGHKVLLFSQYVTMLELIQVEIKQRAWHHFLLTGATEQRGKLVDEFQNYEGASIFLISLKAGGSGLTLTAASYVILYDPWWNPATENQAIDRSHRIGQKSTVIAYRLLVKNSIEEKIRELQLSKGALAADLLGEESFTKALTKDDFGFLLGSGS
jgi:hypothetical protein